MTAKQKVLQVVQEQPEDSSYDEILHELAGLIEESARNPFQKNPALSEAVRKSWITPATLVSDIPPKRRPVAPVEEILRELDEDRSDR
jgi:hypothetical protein